MENKKVLSVKDIYNRFGRKKNLPLLEIDHRIYSKLKTNLISASAHSAYSCCIEYISKWFYAKFPSNFFKDTFLEASHILPYLRTHDIKALEGPSLPVAAISADMEFSFNRDNIDLYNYGANMYNNKLSYKDSFFFDKDRNLFLSLNMEMLLLRFSFKILVAQKGMQIDTAKLCQLAFRSGGTQKHFNDIDYPIPTEIVEQIAADTGYTIDSNDFSSIVSFLNYLNSHSRLPFFYKLNLATGNMEWYIRISDVYIHIKTNEVNVDQGNRNGMKNTNYQINFDCEVRFPSPKFYAYFSLLEKEYLKRIRKIDEKSFVVSVEEIGKIPDKDENGWDWNVKTEYLFNDNKEVALVKKHARGLEIHFEELIGNLRNVIDYTKSIAISPEIFLNIKIFNFDKIVKCHVDWNEYKIVIDDPVESCKCVILIYMDHKYFNDTITKMKKWDKTRIQASDTRIGEDISLKTNVLTKRS